MWTDFFVISVTGIITMSVWIFFENKNAEWKTSMIFVNPRNGKSACIKEKNKKKKYYINGFRVTKKFFFKD